MNGITDFNAFMRYKFDPERAYQYHIDTSLSLQSDYLVDLHGNQLVDFVGKYEQLHDDFAAVCDKLALKNIVLPHKRHAKDREADYRSYYDDTSTELVAKHFQKDIDLLGYQV